MTASAVQTVLWLVALQAWLEGSEEFRAPALPGREALVGAVDAVEFWFGSTLKKRRVREHMQFVFRTAGGNWTALWKKQVETPGLLLDVPGRIQWAHVGFVLTAGRFFDVAESDPRGFGFRTPDSRHALTSLRRFLGSYDAALCTAAEAAGLPIQEASLSRFTVFQEWAELLGSLT